MYPSKSKYFVLTKYLNGTEETVLTNSDLLVSECLLGIDGYYHLLASFENRNKENVTIWGEIAVGIRGRSGGGRETDGERT